MIFGDEVVRWVGLSLGTSWLRGAVIWGTVIAELSVPLLLWRRPRIGVPFAMALHFVFALDPVGHVYDFSGTLYPLFLLFTPAAFDTFFEEQWNSVRSRLAGLGAVGALAFVVLASLDLRASLAAYPLWLFYGIVLLGTVVSYRSRWQDDLPVLRAHVAFVPVLALVLLNGLSPYLELKTTFGFNMYSNLRTEAGEANHFLVPKTFPLRDAQEDLVRIIDSSDEALRDYRDENLGLAYQSLRVYLAERPDTSIRFMRGGEEVDLDRAGDQPELVAPPGLLAQKLGAYRAIDLDAEKGCLRLWRPAL